MSIQWCRLWHDLPTDPKFKLIAKLSGRPLTEVISVYIFLMVDASCNVAQRGATRCNVAIVACALDITEEAAEAIEKAMQGRVLDGNTLTGWDNRQPEFSNSTLRSKRCRERKKDATQCNAAATDATLLQRDCSQDKDKDKENTYKQAPAPTTQLVSNSERFKQFWQNYPKKVGYDEAFTAWFDVRPPIDENLFVTIMAKLRIFRGCRQWIEKDGQYIPRASDFIRDRRWEEEVKPAKHPKAGYNPTGVVL